jgi:putative tricarboxylic transport membrane protein
MSLRAQQVSVSQAAAAVAQVTRPVHALSSGNVIKCASSANTATIGSSTSWSVVTTNAVMALMVGAMTIHGIIPGPQVMTKSPDLFWGMIASMWIGNAFLLVINLPLIGLWVKLLNVPYRLMFSAILLFCCIGIYSINNDPTDVLLTAVFGFVGYAFIKIGFEPAPLLLGFVLGRLMEEKLRQALILSRGDFMTFVNNPVSAVLLFISVAIVVLAVLPAVRKKKEEALLGS